MKEGDVGRIGDRLRSDAEALAGEVDALDVTAFTQWIIASVSALATPEKGASQPGRPTRAAGHPGPEGPGREVREVDDEVADVARVLPAGEAGVARVLPAGTDPGLNAELEHCVRAARAGDPCSTRRLAELLELVGCDDQAAYWWRRAAAVGDPDAIDYVEGILQDSSTSTEPHPEGEDQNLSNDEDPGAFPVSLNCMKLIRLIASRG